MLVRLPARNDPWSLLVPRTWQDRWSRAKRDRSSRLCGSTASWPWFRTRSFR